ncbi:helix-turn-helix domain-containing protein [Streptomyces sp. NPDC060064]|uniref:helix-turn-helix domain-containing protein n=1 Tax=Streptomyces sp. NPDC060064 TaxID=3347049 RepID=UPI0036B3EC1A
MAEQHFSARLRARSARSRPGVGHVDERHPEQFTVVGNHLAQHPELSLTAIGLATHIQSLPDGALVGIKALAAKFPEGETRIAAALRELEAHGYMARIKERMPSGQIVTRTISYNKPQARPAAPATASAPRREPAPEPEEPEPAAPAPAAGGPTPEPPAPALSRPARPAPAPLPEPQTPDLERHRTAAELLAGLRAHDPRLLLSARDVRRLAPAVSAWLERGIEPGAVRRTLTAALPADPIHHPAALLAHRLTAMLPPPLPAVAVTPRPDPLQNCDRCDRAFRAPEPGCCPGCAARGDLAA